MLYFKAVVRAHRELIPDPDGSRKGEISCKDENAYPCVIVSRESIQGNQMMDLFHTDDMQPVEMSSKEGLSGGHLPVNANSGKTNTSKLSRSSWFAFARTASCVMLCQRILINRISSIDYS